MKFGQYLAETAGDKKDLGVKYFEVFIDELPADRDSNFSDFFIASSEKDAMAKARRKYKTEHDEFEVVDASEITHGINKGEIKKAKENMKWK